MKKLVVYFSATGHTKKLAERIAKLSNSDLFEIKPKIPYSNDDLNWMNDKSRSSLEMKNLDFRPEIDDATIEIKNYDIIFLGFPIWWYIAPTIINTFLEKYNWQNKTIIPFATSGGSNMGKTNLYLLPSCNNANLIEGKRFLTTVSDKELKNWIDEKIKT